MKQVRIVHDHSARCIFRDPSVHRPECWYFRSLDVEQRGTFGDRYIHAICNDPDCKGRVRVAVDLLEDYVYSQTGRPR